jgi:DHA2 family multidrug resistance protein
MIPAILGMVSVLAPTLGPTVGGLITQVFGWRWIFFINVAPGVAVTLSIAWLVRIDRPALSMLKRIDWLHLASMALFLAGLEYVLEEGPKQGWFEDRTIAVTAWVSAVALLLFLERSFCSATPIVNLSPFRRPRFAFACLFNIVIGFGVFASVYLIPVYLGRVRGYDSLQIGETVFVVGIAQIISTIIAARVSQTIDRRITISIGLSLFAFSLWLTSHLNADWGFAQLFWPQAVRGLSIMLCIVPSVGMALEGFAGNELRYASGLFNLMRNLGGAIGIATVNTWLSDFARVQAARFAEALGHGPVAAQQMLGALADRMGANTPDPERARLMAEALIANAVGRQALTVAFNDVFRLMAWMFVAALVMVPFCRPAREGESAGSVPVEAH